MAQGVHTVDAILRDGVSQEVSRDTNPFVGAQGDTHIAMGDSHTKGFGDDFATDGIAQDGWIIGFQGYEAPLRDLLASTLLYPVQVFNEGIGGDKSREASTRRIDSLLERHPDATHLLIQYGTNDANFSTPIPSGLGCSGAACNNTFYGYLQDVVDKANLAGLAPVVATPPPVLGDSGTGQIYSVPLTHPTNLTIQEYVQVINTQLTGIRVGTDLYGFYGTATASTPSRSSVFMHNMHPNAFAYRINSQLWHNNLTSGTIEPYLLEDLQPVSAFYKQNLIEEGDLYYMDELYTVGSIPAILNDGIWIMTPNADRNSTASQLVVFDVGPSPVTVYVAYDSIVQLVFRAGCQATSHQLACRLAFSMKTSYR